MWDQLDAAPEGFDAGGPHTCAEVRTGTIRSRSPPLRLRARTRHGRSSRRSGLRALGHC
ncbi:hypothetical protein ACFPRL_03365 [Pseudoclavibacter helvolus]